MKKDTAIFTHAACQLHETPTSSANSPESPARYDAVIAALKKPGFESLDWHEDPPKVTVAQLEYAHTPAYVQEMLAQNPKPGEFLWLDPDTAISTRSVEAALHAAGAGIAAVDHVMAGNAKTAFCAVRPPGHHAEKDKAMGFCIFANAAIAALHAVKAHGLKKVAIIDFDVHYGNGTANIVDGKPEFLFASTHQFPFYPGTGDASEKGSLGNIINVPLKKDDGSAAFRKAFTDTILPALDQFKPEMIVISAGFDAHKDDPLGNVNLTEADYVWVTEELQKIAAKHGKSRIVSMMEGGYNLTSLANSAAAHVGQLMKDVPVPIPAHRNSPPKPKGPSSNA